MPLGSHTGSRTLKSWLNLRRCWLTTAQHLTRIAPGAQTRSRTRTFGPIKQRHRGARVIASPPTQARPWRPRTGSTGPRVCVNYRAISRPLSPLPWTPKQKGAHPAPLIVPRSDFSPAGTPARAEGFAQATRHSLPQRLAIRLQAVPDLIRPEPLEANQRLVQVAHID